MEAAFVTSLDDGCGGRHVYNVRSDPSHHPSICPYSRDITAPAGMGDLPTWLDEIINSPVWGRSLMETTVLSYEPLM